MSINETPCTDLDIYRQHRVSGMPAVAGVSKTKDSLARTHHRAEMTTKTKTKTKTTMPQPPLPRAQQ